MNYRHAYHAGNFADVLKHVVLTLVIAHLKKKSAPFRIIDTHSGTGLYDLVGIEAGKTGEWRGGIGRLLEARARLDGETARVLSPYFDVIASDLAASIGGTASDPLVRYPGSPLFARRMLRPGDALVVNELHDEDREQLADLFHRDRQTKVMGLDGYTALKALLPPKERRGAVLVDPPFEAPGEFERLAGAVIAAHRRFATGVLILWYPIKSRADVDRFHAQLKAAGVAKALAVELWVTGDDVTAKGLTATGLVVVNPPYTLAVDLAQAAPVLADVMATGPGAGARVTWIVAEGERA